MRDAIKWTEEFYPDFDRKYCQKLAGNNSGLNQNKKIKKPVDRL